MERGQSSTLQPISDAARVAQGFKGSTLGSTALTEGCICFSFFLNLLLFFQSLGIRQQFVTPVCDVLCDALWDDGRESHVSKNTYMH